MVIFELELPKGTGSCLVQILTNCLSSPVLLTDWRDLSRISKLYLSYYYSWILLCTKEEDKEGGKADGRPVRTEPVGRHMVHRGAMIVMKWPVFPVFWSPFFVVFLWILIKVLAYYVWILPPLLPQTPVHSFCLSAKWSLNRNDRLLFLVCCSEQNFALVSNGVVNGALKIITLGRN